MNNTINLERENKILKQNQAATVELMQRLKSQVGTFFGEQIDEHLALLQGRRHNPKDWDMADKNGEQ